MIELGGLDREVQNVASLSLVLRSFVVTNPPTPMSISSDAHDLNPSSHHFVIPPSLVVSPVNHVSVSSFSSGNVSLLLPCATNHESSLSSLEVS